MQMSTNDVEIKVTPAQLYEEANDLTILIREVQELLDQYRNLVDTTGQYWEGDASTQFRELYYSSFDAAQRMLVALNENPKDLIQIALKYSVTELTQVTTAAALPSNVIV